MVSILYIFEPKLCMHLSSTHSCLMLPLSPLSPSDRQNAICTKHLIMQYYPAICFFNLNHNFFLSSLFSTTISLFFLLIWQTKFHAHKTTSKIIILHFSVVVLGHSKRDEKRFWTEWLLGILILIESFINISISIFY
jgi:hypothetical protein